MGTDDSGRYVLPFLLPGDYRLTVEKEGFRRYNRSSLKLDVQQTLSLNLSMELGDVATTVEVSAAAPMLSTADSTVKTSISNKSITDLPLNGRLVLNLAATVPGVFTGVSSASRQNDNYTSNRRWAHGNQRSHGGWRPVERSRSNGGARVMGGLPPSPDAVEEFAVQINGLAAEYGRTGGGIINIATKQGTNLLHGTLREFYRNSKMDANDFFANRNRVPLRSFKRNQYGFSVGGPVYMPKLYDGRNRTFFFVDDEFTNERTPANRTDTLPVDEWRRGDFQDY
ncbi:MAG: carboxypeptidase regulatory-like domain-containing protein [Bryobacteraceae bacterium]